MVDSRALRWRRDPVGYWLMKSEPDSYSIDDLKRDGRSPWDGIRNYQARNMMRDDMRVGDEVFFYHSSCKVPAITGIARVASEPYPDPTQFDRKSRYHDPKSSRNEPRWILVDIEYIRHMDRPIPLSELKEQSDLADFQLVKRGNRLSIFPVRKTHWDVVLGLE